MKRIVQVEEQQVDSRKLEKNNRNGGLLGIKGGPISLNEEALVYE